MPDKPEMGPRQDQPPAAPEAQVHRCPACSPRQQHTPADEEAIQADPATQSLARALSTSFLLLKVVMLVLLGIVGLECVTFVDQGKIGLKRRFGAYLRDRNGQIASYEPGELVFVWPAPIETFEEVSQQVRAISLDQEFWPQRAAGNKELEPDAKTVPASDSLAPDKDGYSLTGDLNILHSRWKVLWKVVDAERYQLAAADGPDARNSPEQIVKAMAIAAIQRNMANFSVDAILYENARGLFDRILLEVQDDLRDSDGAPRWGIEITAVTNDGIYPPGKAMADFEAVTGARSEQKKLENEAEAEAAKIGQGALAEANRIRAEAEAYKAETAYRAGGDAERMRDILGKFRANPAGLNLYLRQYRYEIIRSILEKATLYLVGPGQTWFMIKGQMHAAGGEEDKED